MNFKKWSETTESIFTCEFGSTSDPWIRDEYVLPSGIHVYEETYLPRNIFKKQQIDVLVDMIFNTSHIEQLKKCGMSFFDDNRYTEDGEGFCVFSGEGALEKAFNFVESGMAKKIYSDYFKKSK